MTEDHVQERRFTASRHEELLDQIDALELELSAIAETMRSGRVPIAARADFLRAQSAHTLALTTWARASGEHQLAAVDEALEQCRAALAWTRERLPRG